MVRSYCNTRELNSKNKIIDTYIDKIKSIVETEHFSIDNLLSYYDRRLLELQKSNESIEYKNTAKLIVLLTKQIMLRKGYLERANARITNLKMNFPTCLQIVEEKCHLKINLAEGSRIPYLNSLNSLIANYRNNRNYWIKQGLSEEEYQQIIQALEVCRHFVSRQGYLLNEEIVENEKVKSLAPGTNSLYATNYYLYKINELRNDPVELSQFEELFKITDEIFRQCQKHVGATGTDMETSAYTVLGRNPLITKMLEIHPEILDILHEIKNSEERKGYVTRIEAAIFVCEEHKRDLEKKLL